MVELIKWYSPLSYWIVCFYFPPISNDKHIFIDIALFIAIELAEHKLQSSWYISVI